MGALDNIVDVQITKQTATVSRVGFGIPAILTYHTRFAGNAVRYGSLSEMTDAGFAVTDRAYKMASAIFSQNPKPTAVIVGRRGTAPLRDVKLTPKTPLLASTPYDIVINGETMAYTSDATPTAAEITLGITGAVNGGGENVLATDNSTDLDIESADAPGGSATAGVPFEIEFDPSLWEFNDNTPDAGFATDIANMRLANDDWYGLVTDGLGAAEITAIATAIEAIPKIYSAETQDSDVPDSGSSDIASTLKAGAYERTFLMYHYDPDPSVAAAWLGKQLPTDPGSTTWAFKTLATVAVISLTDGEESNLRTKNCNFYQTVAGVNITQTGQVASGEYIDTIRFIDWLTARLKEAVFRTLALNPKIPFTDLGIQTIVNDVEGVLREGATAGGIDGAEPITVTAPRASEVDANTKASRTLPDVNFIATLAGAIHKVEIRGSVIV